MTACQNDTVVPTFTVTTTVGCGDAGTPGLNEGSLAHPITKTIAAPATALPARDAQDRTEAFVSCLLN